jgi:uncharacterized protein YacL
VDGAKESWTTLPVAGARERSDRLTILIIRAIFFASAVGIGLYAARTTGHDEYQFLSMLVAGALAAVVIIVDALGAKTPIGTVSAVVFGLIIGVIASELFIGIVSLMGDFDKANPSAQASLKIIRLALNLIFCFLGVTYILRTKDDIRFIVPYVEFQRRTKGPKPLVLDTSAIIDGRIVDVASKNFVDAPVVVPRFVVEELQRVADSGDKTRRTRGRRGLERLKALQALPNVDVELTEQSVPYDEAVDRKLIELTRARDGKLVTVDFNLVKVCDVEKVPVLNVNDLAQCLRAPVVPGDRLTLKVLRPGEGPQQGVGYLEDGTMVVVERARDRVGQEIPVIVNSALQTSAGRMVFARVDDEAKPAEPTPPAAEPAKEKST